jgi:hypothetical protein
MNSNKIYPNSYELEEVIANIANRPFIDSFTQSRGIFITHSEKKTLSQELSNLFFDDYDLEEIRKVAYGHSIKHTLTGFLIKSENSEFDLISFYENIRINETSHRKKGVAISQLIKINSKPGTIEKYKGTIEYERRRVGRIQFLQNEKGSFDFYIHKKDNGIWQVEVDCNKSTDSGEIFNLFDRNINKETQIETIDLDSLTTKSTISFFDALAKEGLGKEWRFVDVKKLTFKRGKDTGKDEDEIEETVEEENLIGISQAILEGKNLRENSFVKQSEAAGYVFTAMTFEYENKETPYSIQVKAEFKGRPKVFEVGISSYISRSGINEEIYNEILTESEDRYYRTLFWDNAKSIYDNFKSK